MAKIDPKAVAFLDLNIAPLAVKMGLEKWSQRVHHRAVALWWIKALGITDAKRATELDKAWAEVPSGFGANVSQFNQSAGKPTGAAEVESSLADFLVVKK